MIVACPNCLTRFRLDATGLPVPRPMLKCSRCQHIFPGPWAPAKAGRTPASPASADRPEESLSFAFDRADERHDGPLPAADLPEEPFFIDLEYTAAHETAPAHDKPQRSPVRDEPPPLTWEEPEDREEEQVVTPRVSLRPVFIFLALVVSAYAVLARTLYANPEWAEQLLRRVPLVGSAFGGQLLTDQVALVDVQGTYQRSKEGKNFLLITGQALNNAPVPLTQVQVQAKLLNENGTVLEDKSAFCGNSIPSRVLRDLSLHVVEIIPRLKPGTRFLIEPGEKSPFVVVFTDVPTDVAEFTAEVAAAQRQT